MNQTEDMSEQEHYLLNRLRQNYAWLIRDGFTTSANNLGEAITEITKLSERVRELEQIISHVNETPKNEHDSADTLKPAKRIRLTQQEIEDICMDWACSKSSNPADFAHAIMDAMIKKNAGDTQ